MRYIALALILLTVAASATPVRFKTLRPGLSYAKGRWPCADGTSVGVSILKIDPTRFDIRPIVSKKPVRVEAMRQKSGALAVINGPFFDENGQPMGLIIANGRQIQPWPPPSAANGAVFGIRYGRPFIEHRDACSVEGVTQAVQCAPRLMVDGRPTGGLVDSPQRVPRTLIAITHGGHVLMLCTWPIWDGLTFPEAQRLLRELGARHAMALDGGRSTQMSLKVGRVSDSIEALDPMPVGLGVFPK